MSAAKKRAPGSVLGIRSWRHRMAGHVLRQRVEVSDDDRTVATAEVTTSEGSGGTARVSLRAEPGHITPGRRASLVDAVLDLPEVQESARVEAAFRLGDSESLYRLRQRCDEVSTRAAGWSALLDANLPGPPSLPGPPLGPLRLKPDGGGDLQPGLPHLLPQFPEPVAERDEPNCRPRRGLAATPWTAARVTSAMARFPRAPVPARLLPLSCGLTACWLWRLGLRLAGAGLRYFDDTNVNLELVRTELTTS